MTTINTIACMMKRESMLRINLLHQDEQKLNVLLNALSELKSYVAPLGIEMTIGCRMCEALPTANALAMYVLCSRLVEQAIARQCSAIVVQVYQEADVFVLSVFGDVPLRTPHMEQAVLSAVPGLPYALQTKAWEETEVYLLRMTKEVRHD